MESVSLRIKSYVLRGGRMSPAQVAAWRELSDQYVIAYKNEILDIQEYFGNQGPVVVEIGFGMGQATWQIAQENPDINYLCLEVHRPGAGRLLWEIREHGLKNIRIILHDAVDVLETMLAPQSIAGFHVFFPDPWPKKKHHKRRLIKRPFTDLLASRLAPKGYVYFVSDWEDYGNSALMELSATASLKNKYCTWADPQSWRPQTKFEKKGLDKQHSIRELFFIKTDEKGGLYAR